jgi:hypothetical protein
MAAKKTKKRRTRFVPGALLGTAFASVIPACALSGCTGGDDDSSRSKPDAGQFAVAARGVAVAYGVATAFGVADAVGTRDAGGDANQPDGPVNPNNIGEGVAASIGIPDASEGG